MAFTIHREIVTLNLDVDNFSISLNEWIHSALHLISLLPISVFNEYSEIVHQMKFLW